MTSFRARVERDEPTGGAFIVVPLDIPAVFGRARPPVRVTVNGHTYRSTVAVYGGRYFLPLARANREQAGVDFGDEVEVTLAADDAPRDVQVPEDLRAALDADADAARGFAGMSYSHRREYVEWIEEAKRPETRDRRVARCVERVREGLPQR